MEKLARAQVLVADREEAIQVVGDLLKDCHYITQDYIDACQEVLLTYGAYFVIAPGIAFVHSKPASSVQQTGLSLITLSRPVKFGSQDNDPVQIVFMIASTDGESHLHILRKLSLYLSERDNVENLKTTTSDDDLATILSNFNEEV